MTKSTILSVCLGLASAPALIACGSDDGTRGSDGHVGADGGLMPSGYDTDFSRLEGHDPVSLESDLMPIFGLSCNHRSCHSGDRPKAGLYLGPRCDFNTDTGQCMFNQEGEPPIEDIAEANPLTQDRIARVHESLTTASTTAPEVKRAEPGKPGDSFIIYKAADLHEEQGLMCESQSASGMAGPCGSPMPPSGEPLCKQSPEKCDLLATWILQGAENN